MSTIKGGVPDDLSSILGLSSSNGVNAIADQVKKYTDLLTKYGKFSVAEIQKYRDKLESDARKKDKRELLETQKELAKSSNNIVKQFGVKIKEAFANLGDTITAISNKFSGGINSYIDNYNRFLSGVTTRLQGTNLQANRIAQNITRNLGTSPYLRQADMMNNLNKFVESGVAYNLELRSYVATATDKIAATFNAFDSSLLRLIRIQQADSTVARLGMESLLTKFLNTRFEDTSYLSSVGTANITSQLLEAESLMGFKGAAEFDYAVQKWLGSMSALGVSSNTISSLAQGLGYLGSGNISALSGNTALQNLLVMASGGQYGNILTTGLNAQNVSQILQNIVTFGQNIATSGNNVVRSQFANLFGLSVSDLVSLTNITAQDIKAITEDIVTYEKLRQETTNQLATMSQRTSAAEMVSNVLANMKTSLGANIASNPALLATWTVANLMEQTGLDWTINLGFLGTGTSTKLSSMLKTGAIGTSGILGLINAVGALASGNLGGTSLSAWTDVETRGKGFSINGMPTGVTTSTSAFIGTVDETNTQLAFKEQEKQTAEYTGAQEENEMLTILRDSIDINIKNIYNILDSWNNDRILRPNI